MFDFFNVKKRVNEFDDSFIRFRLYLNFIYAIGLAFASPVSTALKGIEFQGLLWLIPFFALLGVILSKYTELLVEKLTIQAAHKLIGVSTLLIVFVPFIYVYNHFLAAIYLSALIVFDGLIFGVYSVFLTNYITKINPELISKYQTTRIHVWADGALLGGILALFIIGNDNVWHGMLAAAVVDTTIVIMFINNYKHIKDIKEEEYKIKDRND